MTNENYIEQYYQKIKSGDIIVGQYILQWYEFIIHGLEEKKFYYNPSKARKAINFIEKFCRHSEGVKGGQLLVLELWQKAFISVIFGIVDSNGYRQFREVILVTGRKSGKTLLLAAICAYMTYADGEYGAKCYFCASRTSQAELGYNAFRQIVINEPELIGRTKDRSSGCYIESTNTSVTSISFNSKRSDGLNIHFCGTDEIASWSGPQGLKMYEVLRSSIGSRTQPMILAITTSGYENDGIYDELINRATSLLKGNSKEGRFAPFLYMIDDLSKWNDINELRKANPNMGVSVSVDYFIEEIAIAEGSLSKKAEFITKYCCRKQSSSQAWLSYNEVHDCVVPGLRIEDFRNSYCVGGFDLSQSTDLTCACVVIERKGHLYVFSKFFMPANRLETAEAEDHVPYSIFLQRGFLQLSGENYIDYDDVYEWYTKLITDYEILPLIVGYDKYSALFLVDKMKQYGFHMSDVRQGSNLSPVIKEAEGWFKDKKIHFDNALLESHILSTALSTDTNTQKSRIVKLYSKSRIDGCAALLDALTVRQANYSELEQRLINEDEE